MSIDRTTALCLACSSSLPPFKSTGTPLPNANLIHITNCCQRPICPSCISSNPRLAKYNPCLACLAGVDLVGLRSPNRFDSAGKASVSPRLGSDCNVDGSTRDQDTFVLGDDDNDGEEDETDLGRAHVPQSYNSPPPHYEEIGTDSQRENHEQSSNSLDLLSRSPQQSSERRSQTDNVDLSSTTEDRTRTTPYKFYLNKRDTLQGICLRFGLDAHHVCKLNNLPLSVVRTTPHILHTRAFLLLPASAKPHPSLTISEREEKSREEKLVRERAEKKLQILTKEVDWRVAKAYVALANDAEAQAAFYAKNKESGVSGFNSDARLEALAIQQYLDDDEWEAEQSRIDRVPKISPLPMKGKCFGQKVTERSGKWWN